MAQYIAIHTLKKSPEEINNVWPELAPKMAKAMAAGETPAKCIKTWNPLPHGRTDYMFCLWEADKPEDIETTLGEWLDYLTVDNFKVDEVDWAEENKTIAINFYKEQDRLKGKQTEALTAPDYTFSFNRESPKGWLQGAGVIPPLG